MRHCSVRFHAVENESNEFATGIFVFVTHGPGAKRKAFFSWSQLVVIIGLFAGFQPFIPTALIKEAYEFCA